MIALRTMAEQRKLARTRRFTCHVAYTEAKELGQEMTASVNRGLYLVTVTKTQWETLRAKEGKAREYDAY